MFKLKTKDWGEVEVSFVHINPGREWDGMSPRPGTQCLFNYDKENHDWLSAGVTNLHPLDYNSYCKEKGRKLSLKRALENLGATREERTQFWKAYFETRELAQQNAKVIVCTCASSECEHRKKRKGES